MRGRKTDQRSDNTTTNRKKWLLHLSYLDEYLFKTSHQLRRTRSSRMIKGILSSDLVKSSEFLRLLHSSPEPEVSHSHNAEHMCTIISRWHKCAAHPWRNAMLRIQGRRFEYSVHMHAHAAAHPETARWLLPWRLAAMSCMHVHPAFTFLQNSRHAGLAWSCGLQSCSPWNPDGLTLTAAAKPLEAEPPNQSEPEIWEQEARKVTYTSLNSSRLVAGVNTSRRPIT